MRWLPNISFSSSSGSQSSSSSFKSPVGESRNVRKSSDVASGWRFGPIRKLTRHRKLRHLGDPDMPSAPEPLSQLIRSPSNSTDYSTARFSSASASASSAKPQPLPLPSYVDYSLPSSKTGPSRGVEERDRGGASSNSSIKSVFGSRDGRGRKSSTDHADKRLSRKEHQDLNGSKSSRDGFRVNVPIRSAPTSPFSSPALSPQRRSAADMFPYYYYMIPKGNQAWSAPEIPTSEMTPGLPPHAFFDYGISKGNQAWSAPEIPTSEMTPGLPPPAFFDYGIPKGNQAWSAPEMPTSDMTQGLPPPAFFDYSPFSCDTSPHHSPRARSPLQNTKSPSVPTSPLHSTARRESNCPVNVHPLPLPPGAANPSSSAPTPQPISPPPISKSESVPRNSQWKKGKLIGRGTFGSVYVATNRETGALCAMKEVELCPDDPKSAECIKQLQQEIKVLSQLKHLNIVQYYGSEIIEDRFYIYLEYVHPGSINKYVREHCGAMTESVVRNFTRHILTGLAYLHSTKTIHRDIKGANLLVDSFGVVKLADFGMAKHLTGQAADLSLKGSPYWMAPELMQAVMQKDSSSDLALAVDIWSLGCTIIEMLTGKPPWSEFEGAAAMFKVLRDTPPIPETLSSEGKDFLRCCFQRNPAERLSAVRLLEHRFLKNSQQLDIPSCNLSFNGKNSMDKAHSPREQSENKPDQLPRFPSTQIAKEKLACESETGQQSHHETPDLTVASWYSPRSTLEALSSLSPPHIGHNTSHPSPANAPSSFNNRAAKKSSKFR
ncbi:mitogen-activated protein kinase kinase kinase 5-like isoform X1 [Juglans microcarpa x Juglans regia]|uniref:mitogen-activated protein kinase kinase kinase 5-like isoform X1 n=1 Tax=Juglans microcarpa x Juglans regia TaxID=2249226 RepID=UPI001B7DC57A|nr:mitogen-activated protein kinase kinase kinase 5-like isoform X1 [Juglans microcarpa x Juglans regia]